MLKFPSKKNKWSGKAQSGFFVDFLFKKIADVFVRNVFIYGAMFFGEKYFIEVLTKKTIDFFVFNTNKVYGFEKLDYSTFFVQIISFLFYTLFLINITQCFL